MNKFIPSTIGLMATGLLVMTPVYATQKVTDMTCKEVLAMGKEYQPNAVYWIEGFSMGGKAKDAAVDPEMFKRPVAQVINDCKKNPQATVHETLAQATGWRRE